MNRREAIIIGYVTSALHNSSVVVTMKVINTILDTISEPPSTTKEVVEIGNEVNPIISASNITAKRLAGGDP